MKNCLCVCAHAVDGKMVFNTITVQVRVRVRVRNFTQRNGPYTYIDGKICIVQQQPHGETA